MHPLLARTKARLRDATKSLGGSAVGALTVGMLRTTRYFDHKKTSDLFARIARTVGPLLREHKIGRANLVAAFPEKSPQEIDKILRGVWENLGRGAAEFAHIDHIWDHVEAQPELGHIDVPVRSNQLFHQLRLDGKPALVFTAHLGNWERPALAAVTHGIDAALLYRRPNIASADRIIQEMRQGEVGKRIPVGTAARPRAAHT